MKDDLLIGGGAVAIMAVLLLYLWNRGTNAISDAASSAAAAVGDAAGTAAQAINPVNSGNIFNRAFESVGQAMTGNPNWTLGGSIYDWTHATPSSSGMQIASADGYTPFTAGGSGATSTF